MSRPTDGDTDGMVMCYCGAVLCCDYLCMVLANNVGVLLVLHVLKHGLNAAR